MQPSLSVSILIGAIIWVIFTGAQTGTRTMLADSDSSPMAGRFFAVRGMHRRPIWRQAAAAFTLLAAAFCPLAAAAQTIPTQMSLTSSPNPSVFGQSVTITGALETQGKALPVGNVAFSRNNTALGVAALQAQGVTVAKLSATNAFHTCAVSTAGRVWCWGFNGSGQLGDGTTTNSITPKLVPGVTGATAVATSRSTTCALITGGAIRCWGGGTSGQLGNGASVDSLTPVAVTGITGAIVLTGGTGHFCAIVAGGAARCWGAGAQGRLGNNATVDSNVPVAVSGLTGATAITAAGAHSCALVAGGAAKCWGSDVFGALGNGPGGSNSAVPVAVANLTGATAISAGVQHTCALVAAGAVRCWGDGGSGQLGNGSNGSSDVPIAAAGVTGATGIASGGGHSCALLAGGAAKCWGRNLDGQLGDGTVTSQPSAVNVAVLSGATALTGGEEHTCALMSDGTVNCWGANDFNQLGQTPVIRDNDGATLNSFSSPSAVTVGFNHSCAIVSGGAVQCWGAGAFGRLGNGSTLGSIKPVTVTGLSGVTKIAAGFSHTCALLSNGTVRCWGNNFDGQIGNGESGETADALTPATVLALSGATDIDAGGGHTCAIVAGGTVKCWGANEDGQLGDGSFTASTTPVDVTGVSGATQISTGSGHTCALIQPTGSLRCWGRGTEGQLGQGTLVDSNTPVVISFDDATGVAAGGFHTCAIVQPNDQVSCWGRGLEGQIGNGAALDVTTPTLVSALTGVRSISAGEVHNCAQTDNTGTFCWGEGVEGQLGNRGNVSSTIPVGMVFATAPAPIVSLSAGGRTSCFVVSGIEIRCSGSNLYGHLGQNAPGIAGEIAGFSLANRAVASISTTGLQGGANTLTVAFAATATHAASAAAVSHTVTKRSQSISFTQPANQAFVPGRTVALSATASSGLAVTLTSSTTSVCTIIGRTARLAGPGTCTIRATQAGNGNFNAAVGLTRSFAVSAASGTQQVAYSAVFNQGPAALAPFGAGAIMAFVDLKSTNGRFAITARRLTATGAPSGSAIAVTPALGPVAAPDIAPLTGGTAGTNGGFVVVWAAPDASGFGIFAQRFSSTAAKVGAAIPVNSLTVGTQFNPKVAPLPGGGFAVVWQTASSATGEDIMLRRFAASGAPLAAESRVNTLTTFNQSRPDIAALANGVTAVVWSSETQAGRFGVALRLYNANGAPQRATETLAANLIQRLAPSPAIIARTGTGASSGFAVAYETSQSSTSATPADIRVKLVSAAGAVPTTSLFANTVTAGHQSAPALAPLRNGAFAAAFVTPDGASAAIGTGIGLRLFGPTGAALGTEERANTAITGNQTAPTLAPIGTGTTRGASFLGAWTTPGPAANGTDLASRRFQGP
ncbi:MAG: hypothetical protein MUC58_02310 [Rhizobiaceae bacterium]|jgi:alpha-tubulin suppressor-like RCC1 family protein|nr:hypothetical protein [Rhizobiaceae bacterium]